jgi:hypothetical protein
VRDITVEANDLFVRKGEKGRDLARVNFISVDGSVNYRLVGTRRVYHVKRENFLRNWRHIREEVRQQAANGTQKEKR